MVQHRQPKDDDPGRTLIGMEPAGRIGNTANGAGSAPDRLTVRVGSGGNLFEIPDAPAGRSLVIKTFPWAKGLPAELVRNFADEATKVAGLHHPHVVPIVDAGWLSDQTPFVVLDRLRGQTLEERIAQRGSPPLAEGLAIVRAAAAALSVTHALGVVHGEVRADNIFMEDAPAHPGGIPRLLDFGVARLAAGARVAGRVVREASGDETVPELRGDPGAAGDHRADQFALAALAHRLLHGTPPPHGHLAAPAFERLWDHEPRAPRVAVSVAEVAAVDGVLARAMSWRGDARYPSVAAFWFALEQALAGPVAEVAAAPTAPQRAPANTADWVMRPAPIVVPAPATAPAAPAVIPLAIIAPPLVTAWRNTLLPAVPPQTSLTQQFFSEGDRLDAAAQQSAHGGAENSAAPAVAVAPPISVKAKPRAPERPTVPSAVSSVGRRDPLATSGTFEHVPRRRAPLIAAALLALAALAIIARAALWGLH